MIGLALAIDGKGQHPQPLPERSGCVRYEGSASGNDPTVRVVLLLCPNGPDLSGELQWSSLNSGWNVRQLVGHLEEGVYSLSDVAVLRERPNPGWYFCTIDAYRLTVEGTSLTGTYVSKACSDQGTLELKLMSTDAPPPDLAPPPEGLAPRKLPAGLDGCACAVVPAAPVSGLLLFFAVALRRRSRCTSSGGPTGAR